MEIEQLITLLREKSNPVYLAGMKRFRIEDGKALGIPLPELRKLAKPIRKNHALAQQLWETGIHEARLLATIIDDPTLVTGEQMDSWVRDFNSWDICDQACGNLFVKTPFVVEKAMAYSADEQEFIKRTGFVMMAEYAVHYKMPDNELFMAFLPIIEKEAWDNRNFVKKAISWALRQIGKRNEELKIAAIKTAESILNQPHKTAKWIATDAIKELSEKPKF